MQHAPIADGVAPAALRPADSLAVNKKAYRKRERANQDKAAAVVFDSPVFCSLLEQQQRVDDLIAQRRAALREALGKPERQHSRVRVTITHMYHPGEGAGPNQEPASWVLIVHGRTLDADPVAQLTAQGSAGVTQAMVNAALADSVRTGSTDAQTAVKIQQALATAAGAGAVPGTAPTAGTQSTVKHPLTSILRRVEVKLQPLPSPAMDPAAPMDIDNQPAQPVADAGLSTISGHKPPELLTWDRSVHLGSHKDSIEMRFRATGAFTTGAMASIRLTMDVQPERYVLPTPVDTLLGAPAETKPRVLQLLAQYVKQQRIMDVDQMVTPRGVLAEVFGSDPMAYQQLQQEVLRRLLPMPALQATHTMTPNNAAGKGPSSAQVFDVEYSCLAAIHPTHERQVNTLLEGLNPEKDLDAVEGEMSTVLKRLSEHKRRRAMLMGLAQSPADFTASILATQARELRIVKGTSLPPIAQNVQLAMQGTTGKLSAEQLQVAVATAAAGVAKEFEVQRRTELFKGKWVEDAVVGYLAKQQAPKRHM